MLAKRLLTSHFAVMFGVCVFSAIVFGVVSQSNKRLEAALQDYKNLVYLKVEYKNPQASGEKPNEKHGKKSAKTSDDADKSECVAVIEMRPDLAPKHVARIKELVQSGFYNGLTFHRVREGFVAQTGDPKGDGTGGTGVNIPAEFSRASHRRGTVSMARAKDENSADSQFFIVLKDSAFLDGQYTVWGNVIAGMHCIDRIKKGNSDLDGKVTGKPDIIKSMALGSDVHKKYGGAN